MKTLNPAESSEYISKTQDCQLLDVREDHEYQDAHIEGVQLIPLGQLPQNLDKLDSKKPVLCICAGGVRSEKAARFLLENGFEDVTNMTEGMMGWQRRGLPIV